MKKLLSGIFAACLFASSFALTWSGVIDNNSKAGANYDFSTITFRQSNGIYLSVVAPVTQSGTLKFSAEGLYRYYLDVNAKTNKASFKNIADCDLLKLSGVWKLNSGAVSLDVGRFYMTDVTKTVFSQTSDGVYVTYDSLKFKLGLYAGYTGLLNRLNVGMNGLTDDTIKSNEQFYRLCPGYIPLALDISYKALLETNTIGAQAEVFIPTSQKNDMRFYGTLYLNGAIGTAGNYRFKATYGTSKFENAMLDTSLDLNFFIGTSAMATAGAEYISGKQGPFDPFKTITVRSVYSNGNYDSGLIVPKIAVLYAKNNFGASLTEKVIVSMPKEEANLYGFDTTVSLVYNVFSDVKIGCDICAFICTQESMKKNSNYQATLKASLAF